MLIADVRVSADRSAACSFTVQSQAGGEKSPINVTLRQQVSCLADKTVLCGRAVYISGLVGQRCK